MLLSPPEDDEVDEEEEDETPAPDFATELKAALMALVKKHGSSRAVVRAVLENLLEAY